MPGRTKAAVILRVLVAMLSFSMIGGNAAAFSRMTVATPATRLDTVAASLATALEMPKHVEVVLVLRNDLVVSVEPMPGAEEGYRVIFEERFFERLTEEEVAAAIAHEIGHVWIYSHFPYLQTEALANEIALK